MDTFPARRSSDQHGDPLPTGELTALIVDDEASYRTHIAVLGTRAGFTTDEACEKNGALSLLAHASYDLLLIDRDIAGLDLLDLVGRLREEERSRNIYAVVISAQPQAERDVAMLAAGFDDCLSKSATDLEITARLVAARRFALRQQAFDRAVKELYGLAARDELTGVFNRRFFLFEAEKMLHKYRDLTVVLFDLDGFKRINDTYGHLTGDRVLRDVGALFQRCTRPDDLLARFGGDEFVMAIGGAATEDVERIAKRLAQEIQKLTWIIGGEELSIGVTIGFSSSQSLVDPMLAQLIDGADRDLYRNKFGKKSDRALPLPTPVPEVRP